MSINNVFSLARYLLCYQDPYVALMQRAQYKWDTPEYSLYLGGPVRAWSPLFFLRRQIRRWVRQQTKLFFTVAVCAQLSKK